ncbi:MAG: hypothetical protein JW807_08085 [Spirochaetes bacterium]|nr:hypothetical protein [Spirochaetota bacterium]
MARIKSTSIVTDCSIKSCIDLAVRAADQCMEKAGIDRNEINMLISIGNYKDDNMAEPAQAALIQHRLGMNLDIMNNTNGGSTFSFDIMNGACGFLYAVRVVEDFMKNGTITNALIISSDVHPSKEYSPAFPYSKIGAAVLLSHSEANNYGFREIIFKTSSDGNHGLRSYADLIALGNEGRKEVTIQIDDDYHGRLNDFSVVAARDYLQSRSIPVSEIKTIISSQPVSGFSVKLSKALGIDGSQTVDLYDEFGDPHSSALILGYHIAGERGYLRDNDAILFIGAGAGLTAACGLYLV